MRMQHRRSWINPVMGVVFVLASRRPVPVRLLASARGPGVSPADAPDTQTETGGSNEGAAILVEPPTHAVSRVHRPRYWSLGLLFVFFLLLGGGSMKALDLVHTMHMQQARLAVAIAQHQEQLHALSFTLQALRREFGIVTEELASDPTPAPVQREPADLATVALSPAETRSLTSLMEQVTMQGEQLRALAREIARLRSAASTPALPSSSRYRAPVVTPSESIPAQEPPPSYAVTLPPALGVTGFTPARPRRTRAPR